MIVMSLVVLPLENFLLTIRNAKIVTVHFVDLFENQFVGNDQDQRNLMIPLHRELRIWLNLIFLLRHPFSHRNRRNFLHHLLHLHLLLHHQSKMIELVSSVLINLEHI
jgi:hypothetical protein